MTRGFSIRILVLALVAAASGCALAEMHPGDSCARCHTGGNAPRFGAAGTVFLGPSSGDGIADVKFDITDAVGKAVSLTSNDVGNFYTTEVLTPPLQVTVSLAGSASVSSTAPSGDCNSCHTDGSSPGRVHVP